MIPWASFGKFILLLSSFLPIVSYSWFWYLLWTLCITEILFAPSSPVWNTFTLIFPISCETVPDETGSLKLFAAGFGNSYASFFRVLVQSLFYDVNLSMLCSELFFHLRYFHSASIFFFFSFFPIPFLFFLPFV